MAEAEEYTKASEQDGLQAKQAVQSNLDASPDGCAPGLPMQVDAGPSEPTEPLIPKKKKKKNKKKFCNHKDCGKKLKKSRAFLACRCGGVFCPAHRLQCDHDCTYKVQSKANVCQSVKFDSLQERM